MHEHAIEHGAGFADMAFDVLQDAFFDTLYLIPFLFVTYLFMEWLEHKTGLKAQEAIRRAGVGGPALGALLGVVPQCGFSAGSPCSVGNLIRKHMICMPVMNRRFPVEYMPVPRFAFC